MEFRGPPSLLPSETVTIYLDPPRKRPRSVSAPSPTVAAGHTTNRSSRRPRFFHPQNRINRILAQSDGLRQRLSALSIGSQLPPTRFSGDEDSMGQKLSNGLKTIPSRDSNNSHHNFHHHRSAAHVGLTKELAILSQDLQRPARLDMLLDMPPVSREKQLKHAWNPDDRSLNIFVKEDDKLTFHRHPVAQSTDCIRGKVSSLCISTTSNEGLRMEGRIHEYIS